MRTHWRPAKKETRCLELWIAAEKPYLWSQTRSVGKLLYGIWSGFTFKRNVWIQPIRSGTYLSWEVVNKQNRKLLQQYFRYGIGITNLALNNLRSEFNYVRKFLVELDQPEEENVCMLTAERMDTYFKQLQTRNLQSVSYNKILMAILHFFQFLFARRYIEKIPFSEGVLPEKRGLCSS